ncbi:unnamed protein product [Euphydryas editha]|uniref:RNA-directed DNA polymerase n=1 Tax=Euphydryas editha TaxID=104508 RepID=A0AAU9TS95_EUPED|nr:unnamed protein product [Euphydryas editha]
MSRIELDNNSDDSDIETIEPQVGTTTIATADDSSTGMLIRREHPHPSKPRLICEYGNGIFTYRQEENTHYLTFQTGTKAEDFIEYTLKYLKPGRYNIYMKSEHLYQIISETYRTKLDNDQIKFIRYTKFLNEPETEEERWTIMHEAHLLHNRHIGRDAMVNAIKRNYFWPKLQADVTKYLKRCEICLKAKYDRVQPKPRIEQTETPDGPMQHWHADIFFFDGKRYLTTIDKFSKFATISLIETPTSFDVMNAFIDAFKYMGSPKKLTIDNESILQSISIQGFLNLNSIQTQHHHTSLEETYFTFSQSPTVN